MTTPGTKTADKTIIYQHAHFLANPGETLQEMLDKARIKKRLASQREWKLGGQNDLVRVWNSGSKRAQLTCGMFHSYELGKSQLILAVNGNVEEYVVSAAAAPVTKDSKHSEFNEGLLFFGIHKNHALIVQSAALRVSIFEQYLNWFLQSTGHLGQNNRIELADPPPRKIVKRQHIDPLKSIVLTPELTAGVALSEGKRQVKDMHIKIDDAAWNPIRDLIRRAGGRVPDELRLDGDFSAERVQVNLELKWMGRKKDRAETPMLDAVLRAFRDVDDPPIKAVTVNGDTIEGNELRLRRPYPMETDGKIPLPGSVYEQMAKYLADLLDKGDIVAE